MKKQVKLLKIYLLRFGFYLVQRLFYPAKKFNKLAVRKILVVRLKHLGDFMLTLPLIDALKTNFPNASIHLAAATWNRALAEEFNQNISSVLYYNVNKYCRKKEQFMTGTQKRQILEQIKDLKVDLTIDLDGSAGFLWLYLLKRTRYLSSADYLRFLQNLHQLGLFKTEKTAFNIHKNHELTNILQTLVHLGINSSVNQFELKSKPATERKVTDFFQDKKIQSDKPLVGINPSASSPDRIWSVENFAKLANQLVETYQVQIIFFGSPEDRPRIHEIQRQMSHPSFDDDGLNLPEYIAAARRCDLMICMDSLSQHVAFLLKIPAVVLYFYKTYNRWMPEGSEGIFSMIYSEAGISVDDVLQKLRDSFVSKFRDIHQNSGQTINA